MHEAFWNGLFDTRWEDAPLGREAIRLVLWLRGRGYSERLADPSVSASAVITTTSWQLDSCSPAFPGARSLLSLPVTNGLISTK